ncbi:MAG: DUF971 domain-containing protein [Pseudomonadota bacterium]
MQVPKDITYHKIAHTLEVSWEDKSYTLPAELLRVYSPSAEVRGHGPDERKLQTGKKHVGISQIEAVGNYAIRITFNDGHDSGIYSWEFLADLGARADDYWQEYLSELKQANGSRLPSIPVGQWTPPSSRG